jgi:hypothetical protein
MSAQSVAETLIKLIRQLPPGMQRPIADALLAATANWEVTSKIVSGGLLVVVLGCRAIVGLVAMPQQEN